MAFHVAVGAHTELFYKLGYVGGMVQKANEYRGLGAPLESLSFICYTKATFYLFIFFYENTFDI